MDTFEIGTKFIARGKRKDLHTIVDIYKTYNSAGELVRIRYKTEHEFMGQIIVNNDIVATTIKLGTIID